MSDKTQKQEMQDAKKENRIPKCISCNHDLKTILIRQDEQISWEWDEDKKTYIKNTDGSSDTSLHDCDECMCEYEDWDFLDENSAVDLGVFF